MIEKNTVMGRIKDALPTIKQKLNGYLRQNDRIKIGATTKPDTRWKRRHSKDGWDRMVLVYETRFPGATRSVEKALIAYARTCNFRVKPDNILPGGESIPDNADAYWIYILLQRFD